MALEAIITRYGIVGILIGAGIEGEPFALAGGLFAHRHLVPLGAAIAAAICGSCLIDQGWFFLGRYFRERRFVQRIAARPTFARALSIIERYPYWSVLLFRFAYGLRAVAPVAIGTSRVRASVFVPLNLVAGIVWGTGFTLLGFLCGPAVESVFPNVAPVGIAFSVGISAILAIATALSGRRRQAR